MLLASWSDHTHKNRAYIEFGNSVNHKNHYLLRYLFQDSSWTQIVPYPFSQFICIEPYHMILICIFAMSFLQWITSWIEGCLKFLWLWSCKSMYVNVVYYIWQCDKYIRLLTYCTQSKTKTYKCSANNSCGCVRMVDANCCVFYLTSLTYSLETI